MLRAMRRLPCLLIPMLVSGPALAGPIDACHCTGGIDRTNRSIPATETYCGYKICGLNNVRWECSVGGQIGTGAGWFQIGNCGNYPPICTGGINPWGGKIDPNATHSGMTTLGLDYTKRQSCGPSGWSSAGPSGSFSETCHCFGGRNGSGAIPYYSTWCGYATVGSTGEKWQCTVAGWDRYAASGEATDNKKFGINSATWLDPNRDLPDQKTAKTYRMKWYLMMIGNQEDWRQIDWRIAPAIANAREQHLTTILRLCDGTSPCKYQMNADKLVGMLNDPYLYANANGNFYVIAGPNEPPSEKWMTPETEALKPACRDTTGALVYCDKDLDLIATEMAKFSDHVLKYVPKEHRIKKGGRIGLLSPVWDCHNPYTPKLMKMYQTHLVALGRSMSAFEGIAVNAYNLHGQRATHYIDRCRNSLVSATGISDYAYFLTETGMLEAAAAPAGDGVPAAVARDDLRELLKSLRSDPTIKAALLFDPTGGDPDPNFAYDRLATPEEWYYVLGGHAQL